MKYTGVIAYLVPLSASLFFSACVRDEPQSVEIGNQVWSAKNLDVVLFANGDSIPEAQSKAEWLLAAELELPAWCYYNENPFDGEKYGKLYNWYAVHDIRGIAPKGWEVPTNQDWKELFDFLGGTDVAGIKMKSKEGWIEEGNGTDTDGFTALASGYRDPNADFKAIGVVCGWWSNEAETASNAWACGLMGGEVYVTSVITVSKGNGNGVRLIKSNY
jgi:uncharacterized protein (TIGR02145 family)